MSTVTFIKKVPAGALGNFNWHYKCTCANGVQKEDVVVTSANEGEAKKLAKMECDEKCNEI
ncbi:hypothetical protein HJB56_09810 [Rhizobium lentis]|uniref:hypothetical protein n=1 Tax=Rhizobium lentis TaxID=1138194 RepID=UPI001C83B4BB|nr:hypothetical protein [Rhizobium lentis]MBX5083056.1 hypothetical protein [Rhizobium lentis]MBX5095803.1 hypothetical protein [Rhizobium lentis]MBX5120349.1 hypothetical protein [Rhizobium lentis]